MAVAALELMALPRVRPPASTYRRRQVVAAGLVVGLVLVVWAALGVLGAGTLPVPERPSQSGPAGASVYTAPHGGALYIAPHGGALYTVQPGDTFWSIAQRLKPHADPRPLVDKLVAAHGGSTLHVGERIPIPA